MVVLAGEGIRSLLPKYPWNRYSISARVTWWSRNVLADRAMNVQFVLTLVLIACAAFIALICDFLRVRDAQLQQAMAELKARNYSDTGNVAVCDANRYTLTRHSRNETESNSRSLRLSHSKCKHPWILVTKHIAKKILAETR
jgi:hypothetical protein